MAAMDAGEVIRQLRRRVPELKQWAIARMCGVHQSTISRVERGRPLDRNLAHTALEGLGARSAGPASPSTAERAAFTVVPSSAGREGPPTTSQTLWQQISEASESEAVRVLRIADRELAGGDLYTLVMRYLSSRVGPMLVSENGDSSTFIAAAGLTEMAGWMAHDSGRDDIAARHFQRALNLARASEASTLVAQIWASRAHLSLHRSDADTALIAAEQAWRHLDGSEDTALRGRVLAMLTRAHAAQGDASAVYAALTQAEHLLSIPMTSARSEWTSPFDLGSLESEAARSLCDLGDHTAAAEHARHALRLRSAERVRARALASLTLARALLGQGQVEEAASVTGEVAGSASSVRSVVTGSHLRDVAGELGAYRHVPAVATVLHDVRDTLARAEHERLAIEGKSRDQ
ncbi:hypothetical protein [Nocardiopsis sp. FR6]|uniref:hypothetical protein n=2 Tax=unclassified Nocardiopsis TaxID=2649073 RepID=UPI001357C697